MRTADQWLIGAFGLLLVILVSLCVSTSLACSGFIESWSCSRHGLSLGLTFLVIFGIGIWALADLSSNTTRGYRS